jgi:hypothetical protein
MSFTSPATLTLHICIRESWVDPKVGLDTAEKKTSALSGHEPRFPRPHPSHYTDSTVSSPKGLHFFFCLIVLCDTTHPR